MGEPILNLDRQQLRPRPDHLGECGQEADLKGARIQQDGKGGEIVFPATLHGCRKCAFADRITPAGLAGIEWCVRPVHCCSSPVAHLKASEYESEEWRRELSNEAFCIDRRHYILESPAARRR